MPNLNKLGLAVLVFLALLVVAGSGTITVAGQWAGNRWIDRGGNANMSVMGAISTDGTFYLVTTDEVKPDEWKVAIVVPQGGKVSQFEGGVLLEQAKSMPAIRMPSQLSLLATPTPRVTITSTPPATETSTATPTTTTPEAMHVPTATATATPPAAATTTCAIKGAGDLNHDGRVDALDLVLAASQYDKLEPRVAMGRLVAVGSNYDCDYNK